MQLQSTSYRHFKLAGKLLMCEWANDVAEIIVVTDTEDPDVIYRGCSRCHQEVKYDGDGANIVQSNNLAHLGNIERVRNYRTRNHSLVDAHYHHAKTAAVKRKSA